MLQRYKQLFLHNFKIVDLYKKGATDYASIRKDDSFQNLHKHQKQSAVFLDSRERFQYDSEETPGPANYFQTSDLGSSKGLGTVYKQQLNASFASLVRRYPQSRSSSFFKKTQFNWV